MPVADHPTHESTKKVGNRPGCWDRPPLKEFLFVKDGFRIADIGTGHVLDYKVIYHTMSTDCKSNLPECRGCCNYQERN